MPLPDNCKTIAKRVAEKKGLDEELIKNIISHGFHQFKERYHDYDNLRYSFRGLFTFFYRKTKLEARLVTFKKRQQEDEEDEKQKIENLLTQYEKYIQTKKEVRAFNKAITDKL